MRGRVKQTITWMMAFVMILALLPIASLKTLADDENPEGSSLVESITVDDVKVLQGDKQYYNGEGYCYDVQPSYSNSNIEVVLKDGTSYHGSLEDIGNNIYNDTGKYLSFFAPDQPVSMNKDELWGVGTHTATVTLGDYTGTYNFVICENPVASISVEDIRVIEHTNGSWGGTGRS